MTFGWRWRTTLWVYIISVYCVMSSGAYAIDSIVSVAAGLYLLDAYTVRKFCWGYALTMFSSSHSLTKSNSRAVWHQMLRNSLTNSSNFLASAPHLPSGTFATYLKLFASFFISGLARAASATLQVLLFILILFFKLRKGWGPVPVL